MRNSLGQKLIGRMRKARRGAPASLSARITLVYIVIGGCWVLFSDRLVPLITDNLFWQSYLHTLKGWIYVGVTGALLYAALRHVRHQLLRTEHRLRSENHRADQLSEKQQQARYALMRSEHKYRLLFEGARDGILLTNLEGEILEANPQADSLFDWHPDQLAGQKVKTLFADAKEADLLYQQLRAEQYVRDRLVRFDAGNGYEGLLAVTASLRPSPDAGGSSFVKLTLRDVTARERKVQRLRILETAVRQAAEGVVVLEAHPSEGSGRQIEYVNRAFAEMTGFMRKELVGRTLRALSAAPTPFNAEALQTVRESLAAEEAAEVEVLNHRKSGEPFWVACHFTPVYNEAGECIRWLVLFRDVTEQKQRIEELKTAKEVAEQAHRLKSAMLDNLNHEIRTPLAAIQGYAEVMIEETSGQLQEFARVIKDGSRRLLKTMNLLLDLAKARSGERQMQPEPTHVARVMQDIVKMHEPQAKEKGLSLHLELPEEPCEVRLDEAALSSVLENLIDNGIKYTPSGTVEVGLEVEDDADRLCVWVKDTGIGMSEAFQSRMFEPFEQESIGLSRDYEGVGLGLSIVRQFTALMDGSVEVQSRKGKGSCFTIHLPLTVEQTE